MNSLRIEADEAAGKVEELQKQVKHLEQENLQKEHEITSLQHKNNGLEAEVEKLETQVKDLKTAADEGTQHGTQNETLQRRLQLLEEEAEEADKNLRETNDKYVNLLSICKYAATLLVRSFALELTIPGSVKPMSRPATSSVKFKPSSKTVTSGRRSTRKWPRNTPLFRRNWMISRLRLETFKWFFSCSREC